MAIPYLTFSLLLLVVLSAKGEEITPCLPISEAEILLEVPKISAFDQLPEKPTESTKEVLKRIGECGLTEPLEEKTRKRLSRAAKMEIARVVNLERTAIKVWFENELWLAIRDSGSPESFRAYRHRYPNSPYAKHAETRFRELEEAADEARISDLIGSTIDKAMARRRSEQIEDLQDAVDASLDRRDWTAAEHRMAEFLRRFTAETKGKDWHARLDGWTTRIAQGRHEDLKELKFEFVPIDPGRFRMGCDEGENSEKPLHTVELTNPFQIGKYEVTQAVWERIMGYNPSKAKGRDLPVESVSWLDVQDFLGKLNEGQDLYQYRLPTEAEWEYVARAGGAGCGPAGKLKDIAWFKGNSGNGTQPVGDLEANAWGLYDTLGNVWEWCWDWWSKYPEEAVTPLKDPDRSIARPSSSGRVVRGGSFDMEKEYFRYTSRGAGQPQDRRPHLGFRCVRERITERKPSVSQ